MLDLTLRQRVVLAVVPRVAAALIRLLGATLRYRNLADPSTLPGDQLPRPAIFVFWHRALLISAHRFRHQGIAILISRSYDGELIARTVERLGFLAVRGSSSRGGSIGLRGMERAYGAGRLCAITADGPRGPALVAKSGAAQLAALVGATSVGAFYALPERAWTLRTWDRFLIPKPFSRVVLTWPAPAVAQPGCAVETEAVQAALDRSVARSAQPDLDSDLQ